MTRYLRAHGREILLLLLLLGGVAYLGATTNFLFFEARDGTLAFNQRNIMSLLSNSSVIAIAAVGATLVILTGQIDISIGSILVICVFTAGYLDQAGVPVLLIVPLTVLAGAALGAINGALAAYAGIPSIIVTLGTMTIYRSALLAALPLEYLGNFSQSFRALGLARPLGLPLPVWVMLVSVLASAWVLANTRWGRNLYAVGSNSAAAALAGVRVPRVQFQVLLLSGAFTGLGAAFHGPRFSQINANEGMGFEFVVITAVVLGGINIFGGSGSVLGAFLGVLLLGLMKSSLIFVGLNADWERFFQGLFILVAVTIDIIRTRSGRRLPFKRQMSGVAE
jgi:ribose/xylose/arabinose/galactoside ABC-type transport system permease subunit